MLLWYHDVSVLARYAVRIIQANTYLTSCSVKLMG